METHAQATVPSHEAVTSISKHYNAIKATFPGAEADFECKWVALVTVWNAQQAARANTGCAETSEFESVKRLGPKIIPFVVFKLAKIDGENGVVGLAVYEALESDASYRVVPDDESPYLSFSKETLLQNLCSKVVELNYQRNRIFEQRVAAWKSFHTENALESDGLYFCFCDEYEDLLEMGTSIIGPLMVEYERFQGGYWFHLLHELIHGHKFRAHSYMKRVIYQQTVHWFVEGNHEDAPLYVPTELDRKLMGDLCGEGFWDDLDKPGRQ